MKKNEQHIKDFNDLRNSIIKQKQNIKNFGVSMDVQIRLNEELNKVLFKVEKLIKTRVAVIKEVTTFDRRTFKLKDKFYIIGNRGVVFKIKGFPDYGTVIGESKKPVLGHPTSCTVTIDKIQKYVKRKKKGKKEKVKKGKKQVKRKRKNKRN